MIDLHCHILPGIDDGAIDLRVALHMARQFVQDGVSHVACTPHIFPGVWNNAGPAIRRAVIALQNHLDEAGIPLTLLIGSDNHIASDLVAGLKMGKLLCLGGSRYVLVEPSHHTATPRLPEIFSDILQAGYVPVLTHPERLNWMSDYYELLPKLVAAGTLMQITAGSLSGRFGDRVQALALRMLEGGLVHIIATDAHDPVHRPPLLSEGWSIASRYVGREEANKMVLERPFAMLTEHLPLNTDSPATFQDLITPMQTIPDVPPRSWTDLS